MCFEEFMWSITFDLATRIYLYTAIGRVSLHIGKEKNFSGNINNYTMPKIGMLSGRHTQQCIIMLYVIEIKV